MTAHSTSSPQGPGCHVLVVVPDDELRLAITEVVTELGHVACEVRDGPSGLQLLSTLPTPKVVLLDVGRSDGMELLNWIRADESLRSLKVIALASMAGFPREGFAQVLGKPFAMEDLREALRTHCS